MPAGVEYVIVGFCMSVKFGAFVIDACLGIVSSVTVLLAWTMLFACDVPAGPCILPWI